MRTLLLALILSLCSSSAWAATITSATFGNFSSASTWVGGVKPVAGDTAVIAHAVTATGTRTIGADGATGTAAVTVNQGGALNISGTLNCRGDLVQQRGSTVEVLAGGNLVLDAATGTNYAWTHVTTGAGNATYKMTGSSGSLAQVSLGIRGGTGQIILGDSSTKTWGTATFSFAKITGLGTTSVRAVDCYPANTIGSGWTLTDSVFNNCGFVNVSLPRADNTFVVNRVAFISPKDTNTKVAIKVSSTVALVAGTRTFQNVSVYSEAAAKTIQLYCKNLTVSNIVVYNTSVDAATNLASSTVTGLFAFADISPPTTNMFLMQTNSAMVLKDSAFLLGAYDNPHFSSSGGTDAAVGTNEVNGVVYDGDGHVGAGDSGDCHVGNGTIYVHNSIAYNKAGVLVTQNTANGAATITNNTTYQSQQKSGYGSLANVGETAGAATQLASVQNNLIVDEPAGLAQQSAFVRQTGFTLDYNAFYLMSQASNLDLGAVNGYLGANTYSTPNTWWNPDQTYGVDRGTHDIPLAANPFRDSTVTIRGYMGAASVQAAARIAVTASGFDYTGAVVAPSTKTVAGAIAYVQNGFTPTNAALKGTGSGGADIGAVAVYVAPVVPVTTKKGKSGWGKFNFSF